VSQVKMGRTVQLHYFSEHGRWPDTPYPFLILHGPHGYMIQFRDLTERDAITKENEECLHGFARSKTSGVCHSKCPQVRHLVAPVTHRQRRKGQRN
jgi:hypothetical protein